MEGIVAMNKNQRQVYQLATEVIRRKPKRQRVLAVGWEVLSPGKADRDAGQEERCPRRNSWEPGTSSAQSDRPDLEVELESLLRTKYYDFNLTHFRK